MQNNSIITAKLLGELVNQGDIFTDSPENRGDVAIARNLQRLAAKMVRDAEPVGEGVLYADGERIGATLVWVSGAVNNILLREFDYTTAKLEFEFEGVKYPVTLYPCREDSEGDQLVISSVDAFYDHLLKL